MSANGKEKLIAKLQHFYDTITNVKQQNEDFRLVSNDPSEKEQRRVMAECYQSMCLSFSEVFKEFLYNAERDDT